MVIRSLHLGCDSSLPNTRYTVRPDNWNEKLGVVDSGSVCVLAGNEVPGGGPLQPVTLRSYLASIGPRGGKYCGLGTPH